MNYAKKMLIYALIQTAVGIILLLATIFIHFSDGFKEGVLSGIAGGLVSTGILGIVACLRLIKNPARAMEVEIAKDEERTLFLKAKANSASYSVTLYIEAIGILAAALAGFRETSMTLAVLLLVQLVFNMGFAYYYGQKY
ncbi:MAG TPA: hypothetical protein GXX35_00065 [Thermoanaerobacterales bacterium]|nr:hypothetical protein [Thermoanaerobacterales bacterium]